MAVERVDYYSDEEYQYALQMEIAECQDAMARQEWENKQAEEEYEKQQKENKKC